MDERQAFGVVTALGKALAETDPNAITKLRATHSPTTLAELLRAAPAHLPETTLESFLARDATEATWERTRAKLILAVQLALGKVERRPGHEEKGGVTGRKG